MVAGALAVRLAPTHLPRPCLGSPVVDVERTESEWMRQILREEIERVLFDRPEYLLGHLTADESQLIAVHDCL